MIDNLCIIPARGGSKRIPRKNIKDFLGKPIIAYSIEAAINSGLFDEVMVSTEDEEIAKIALKYGAKVPFVRSEKNADDFASTYDVIEEVLLNYNKTYKYACCIYPCAPFVNTKHLKEAYTRLISFEFDSVYPVTEFSYPIQRAIKIENNKAIMIQQEYIHSRSQDLITAYHDVGQFYWMNVKKILHAKKILTNNSGVIKVSNIESQDIDTETDWKIATLKYKLLHGVS